MSGSPTFAEKYGPWAIVAGASEGVGRELARKVAANGVQCILVARREKPLAELRPFGVDVLCLELVMTDTPALRKLLAEKGQPVPSRMASPTQVAEVGLRGCHSARSTTGGRWRGFARAGVARASALSPP